MLTMLRCAIAIGITVACALAIQQIKDRDAVAAADAAQLDVDRLPAALGEWKSEEVAIDKDILADGGAIRMIERTFVNPQGHRLAMILATFPAGEATLPHPPDLCYTGKGWNVTSDRWEADPAERSYKLLQAEKTGQRVFVAYWYQLRDRVVSNRDELRVNLQQLRWDGESWPPLVKVLIHVPVELSEDDAKTACENFGAEMYRWILQNS